MPSTASQPRLLPYLIISNLLTLLLLVAVGALYFDTRRLNEVLLEQRTHPVQPPRAAAPAPRSAPAVAARSEPAPERTLLDQVPANLAEGAEVLVVSGYESGGSAAQVRIERPGKDVVLVLSSYETVAWQVVTGSDTRLRAIIVAAHEKPRVAAEGDVPVYLGKLPYVTDTESINFVTLLGQLKSRYGIARIEAFRGAYEVPGSLTLSQTNPDDPRLTAAGEPAEKPIRAFNFELLGTNDQHQAWSLQGPQVQAQASQVGGAKQAKDAHGRLFSLKGHNLTISDASGQAVDASFPDNFPRLSWPSALAYDSQRDLISLVSFGGEGYLYRYDAARGAWKDYRSLQNTDLQSLAYDPSSDRYVGWTSWGSLYFMNGEGEPSGSIEIIDRLKGFKRLYDHANRPAPPVLLAPRGEQLAILALDGDQVAGIWYYDLELDVTQHTYRRP